MNLKYLFCRHRDDVKPDVQVFPGSVLRERNCLKCGRRKLSFIDAPTVSPLRRPHRGFHAAGDKLTLRLR